MDKYGKYVVAALFAIGGFTLVAGASPLAATSMAASELLFPGVVAAVAGWLGFGPVSNWLSKTFFNKDENPNPNPSPNNSPENSESSSDDDDSENELELENELDSDHNLDLATQRRKDEELEDDLGFASDRRDELGELLEQQYEDSPELGDETRRSAAKPVLHNRRAEELREEEKSPANRRSPRLVERERLAAAARNDGSDEEVLASARSRKGRRHH